MLLEKFLLIFVFEKIYRIIRLNEDW